MQLKIAHPHLYAFTAGHLSTNEPQATQVWHVGFFLPENTWLINFQTYFLQPRVTDSRKMTLSVIHAPGQRGGILFTPA